jgi:hypothetical protein
MSGPLLIEGFGTLLVSVTPRLQIASGAIRRDARRFSLCNGLKGGIANRTREVNHGKPPISVFSPERMPSPLAAQSRGIMVL